MEYEHIWLLFKGLSLYLEARIWKVGSGSGSALASNKNLDPDLHPDPGSVSNKKFESASVSGSTSG